MFFFEVSATALSEGLPDDILALSGVRTGGARCVRAQQAGSFELLGAGRRAAGALAGFLALEFLVAGVLLAV